SRVQQGAIARGTWQISYAVTSSQTTSSRTLPCGRVLGQSCRLTRQSRGGNARARRNNLPVPTEFRARLRPGRRGVCPRRLKTTGRPSFHLAGGSSREGRDAQP